MLTLAGSFAKVDCYIHLKMLYLMTFHEDIDLANPRKVQWRVLKGPMKGLIVEWMIVENFFQNLDLQFLHCSLPLLASEAEEFEIRNYLDLKVCWQLEREEGRRSMQVKELQMLMVDLQMFELDWLHAGLLPDKVGEVLKEDFGMVSRYCRRHHPNVAPVCIFLLLFASDVFASAATLAVPPGLMQY